MNRRTRSGQHLSWSNRSVSGLFVVVKSTVVASEEDIAKTAGEDNMIDYAGETVIAHVKCIAIGASHCLRESLGTSAAQMTGASCLLFEPALQRMRRSVAYLSGSRQFFNY